MQKRAIKWINHGENYFTCPSYTANPELYYIDCKQLQILPIRFRFHFRDLIMLHSIIYGLSFCKLPSYLSFFSGNNLRSSHLDYLCLVSSITPNTMNNMNTESKSGFLMHIFIGVIFFGTDCHYQYVRFLLRKSLDMTLKNLSGILKLLLFIKV